MTPDSEHRTPDEPEHFRFIEAGTQLTYEFESLGTLQAALFQTIDFCPVVSFRGWSKHKEMTASLRLKHYAYDRREIGSCLLDRDEVTAWHRMLLRTQEPDAECSQRRLTNFEYITRHGIKMVCKAGQNETSFLMYISGLQAAILQPNVVGQLLNIFEDFETLYRKYL